MGERVFIGIRAFIVVVLAVIVTLVALPAPMRSSSWTPERAPNLEGPFLANHELERGEKLASGEVVGPESIAIDEVGRVYTGTTDGKIVRVVPDLAGKVEVFADTGGRPLGMAFAPNGDLLVADVIKGLLRVDPSGRVELLAHEAEGRQLVFANSVVVSKDGNTVFLTDSSSKWGYGDQINDILEQEPSGRLLRFDMKSRTATVMVRGLAFANGIALAPDESYLLVVETARYRVTRVWLTGERRNLTELFVDNLPGFPDNISASPRGTFWVALYSVRKPLLDFVHPFPFLKDTIAGLPDLLRPRMIPYGLIFEIDAQGHVMRSFHDPDGVRFRDVTDVIEHKGVLYLGTLSGSSIGRFSP